MDDFEFELWMRLPLAQAVLKLAQVAMEPAALNELFDLYRGSNYEKVMSFDTFVHLICDVLVTHRGAGHAGFSQAREDGRLPVAMANVYAKLSRVPIELSAALLQDGTQRLLPLMPAVDELSNEVPMSLREFSMMVIDGKKIKNASKRLKPLRGQPGSMLGGKLLVALSLPQGLAVAMAADPDGERNDVPLVGPLVQQVRAASDEARLWIADRQFADLSVPVLLSEGNDHYLIRHSKRLGFQADLERPAKEHHDAQHRRVVQQWGWVGRKQSQRLYVRLITLHREGEEEVTLMTDLLDESRHSADDLLHAYLQRWGIERMFQQVTEVFNLQTLIGSTPAAMIFQSAMCFLLYNMIQVVRAYVADAGAQKRERVSTEKLFKDVQVQMTTWMNMGSVKKIPSYLPTTDEPADVIQWMKQTLAGKWRKLWLKAPPQKKRSTRPAARTPAGHGGHTSVHRVLQDARKGKGARP